MFRRTLFVVALAGLFTASLTDTGTTHDRRAEQPIRTLAGQHESRSDLTPDHCSGPMPIAAAVVHRVCGQVRIDRPTGTGSSGLALWVEILGPRRVSEPPVLVIPGGPGRPGTTDTVYALDLYPELAQVRDVIFFDPRGIGRSEGVLGCPRRIDPDLAQCFADVRPAHVDRSLYSSASMADDIEALRVALGVEKWSLWGSSYGGEVAQHVIIRHPHSVDTAVLAVSTSLQTPQPVADAAALREAVHGALAGCETDTNCAGDERRLGPRFEALLERIATRPMPISGPSPAGPGEWVTAQDVTLTAWWIVHDWTLTGHIGELLFSLERGSTEVYEQIIQPSDPTPGPVVVRHPLDDLRVQADRRAEYLASALTRSLTLCNDGLAGMDANSMTTRTPWWDIWHRDPVPNPADCSTLGVERPQIAPAPSLSVADSGQIVPPILVMSGANDSRVPPSESQNIVELFPAAFSVEFPWYGHLGYWEDPCPQQIMSAFLDAHTRAPDTGCIADLTFANIYGEDCDRPRGLAVPAFCPHPWYDVGVPASG